eukprot:CAMPEP_0167825816 /NCGR_PEP_ID=MMETSP0112_2-20121227/9616_1 /TAXON_ID=91324 /ORGANISM="Lotharella globosa, Strain CCCM811" /LENGTH=528 /DNA_ID=CAMNT_0007728045 /DNA_START=52 /DNA_END=1638 /DNA_ORIENTATION=+
MSAAVLRIGILLAVCLISRGKRAFDPRISAVGSIDGAEIDLLQDVQSKLPKLNPRPPLESGNDYCDFSANDKVFSLFSKKDPSMSLTLHGNVKETFCGEVRGNGVCYDYVQNGKPAQIRSASVVLPRAELCSPMNKTVYLEITVGMGGSLLDGIVSIGLVAQGHSPSLLPGLGANSWALHSDDGRCYTHNAYKHCTRPWKAGDVVGVGVEPYNRRLFFTLNGIHQGVAFDSSLLSDAFHEDLLLAVGVTSAHTRLRVNTGPHFRFDPTLKLNDFGKSNQVFARFDVNDDNYLDYSELKTIIRATSSDPEEPFSHSNYVRFCQITSANPVTGMSPNAFYMLFELNFGDIDEDYYVLTTNATRTPVRPVLSTAVAVAKNSAPVTEDNPLEISIDGGWSEWGECSHVCGYQGVRKRTCTEPAPQGTGRPCDGDAVESCNRHRCYDGAEWTSWTPCSTTCGAGVQFRTCMTDSLSTCDGEAVRMCKNRQPCTPNDYVHIDEMDRDLLKSEEQQKRRVRTQERFSIKLNAGDN